MDGRHRLIAGTRSGTLALLLAVGASEGIAQSTFKCANQAGRITYTNIPCEKQGLKNAGAVAERTTTLRLAPAPRAPAPGARAGAPAQAPAQGPAQATDEAEVNRGSVQIKPLSPLIEKLLK